MKQTVCDCCGKLIERGEKDYYIRVDDVNKWSSNKSVNYAEDMCRECYEKVCDALGWEAKNE